jgi:hypothetical protein
MATDIEKLLQDILSLPPEEQKHVRDAIDQGMTYEAADGERPAEEEFQRRLVEAGLLKEIKRPLRDAEAFKNGKPVEIKGKPLSETVIKERR